MNVRTFLALFVLALALTGASAMIQRVGPLKLVEGEGFCPGREPCYIPALGAGFPLPYMVDNPQVSVPYAVHLFEDDFRPGGFVLDMLTYFTLGAAGLWLWRRRALAQGDR